MMKQAHLLAGATLVSAILATLPAHAGLLGGSVGGALGAGGAIGPVGGAVNGSLHGDGALRTPSARPMIERTQDKATAAQDRAVQTTGTVKDKAAATAAHRPAVGLDAAANGALGMSNDTNASTRKAGASASADGGASAETRNRSIDASASGSTSGSITR